MRDHSLRVALPWTAATAATTLAIGLLWLTQRTPDPDYFEHGGRNVAAFSAGNGRTHGVPLSTGGFAHRAWPLPSAEQCATGRATPCVTHAATGRTAGPGALVPVGGVLSPCPKPIDAHVEEASPNSGPPGDPKSAPQWFWPDRPDRGGTAERSRALELAAREADMHIQRAFELASLGAYYSSRAELIRALRLVAQALDTEHQTTAYGRALAAGLTAMREAQDFLPTGSRLQADLDMAGIIAGHQTPVLKGSDGGIAAPQAALQTYFTFAQEQLGAAVGEEIAGSMAYHALGKLHAALARRQGEKIRAATPKAMAFYQAALLVNPLNYMASNDLGVLLARASRYEDARVAVEHSLSIHPNAAGWRNLSVIYGRLGQSDLAQRAARLEAAFRQAESARRPRQLASGHTIQWVDANQFGQTYRPPAVTTKPSVPNQPAASAGLPFQPVIPPFQAVRPASYTDEDPALVRLCQALGPAAPCDIRCIDCSCCNWCRRGGWESARAMYWQAYAQGEYVGHARTVHVDEYRLRPDDQLDMIFRVTRDEQPDPYKFNVGDEIRVESVSDPTLNRDAVVLPDGTIVLRLIGEVRATGKTVVQLRDEIERAYLKYYKVPAISVIPLKVNTQLEDLRSTVDRRQGIGGQSQLVRVTPDGTIALPAIGSVPAQGLTLPELQQEINERYREQIEGMEIIPVLVQRAPRYVYVLGEVRNPGRFELVGPTTIIQAISMAGGWNVGANLRQVVVFRRGDDWRLLATVVHLQAALYGNQPCPGGEIWLSDSDVVIVPKGNILIADEFVDLVFTRGIYGVFPLSATLNFSKLSTL